MIVIKITGGLGNQMFQYAFARSLAWRRHEELKLDLRWFDNILPGETARDFKLDHFNIIGGRPSTNELEVCKLSGWERWQQKLALAWQPDYHYRFHKNFISSPKTYFEGFFHSYKYFADCADAIYEDFKLRDKLNIRAAKLAEQIKSTASASLHIRRGDYVSNPKYNQDYGLCPLEYYQAAIRILKDKAQVQQWFVFSDDPAWVKANLVADEPLVHVSQYGFDEAIELYLMSLCQHNVIANSSFSWWGAWLNQNPDKLIIAPNKWTNNKKFATMDLIPDGWFRL